jgi:hypothetical protein
MIFKLIVISLILLINIGFAFSLILSSFYQSEGEDDTKYATIISFFSGEITSSETEFTKIVNLLKQDKNIETKTIMGFSPAYSFHTNSKFIFTSFNEGLGDDTIKDFITRENWSEFEYWFSAINSVPPHKDVKHEIPDYLIYHFLDTVVDLGTTWYNTDQDFYIHSLLVDHEDENLQKFLKPIYFSKTSNGGVIVYEISFDKK